MRYSTFLLAIFVSVMIASCGHRPHGRRPMTHEDSVRRAADIAEDRALSEIAKMQEELEGPTDPGSGTGEVIKGPKFKTNMLDDSTASITSSFERYSAKIQMAQKDSTTLFGVLMTRFRVLDSQHKYLAATYSSTGHLLTFHSEITKDDKHELDYDLYFDKGKLRYIRERRTYTLDDDEQDLKTDDSYFMSGATPLYWYRDEGHAAQQRDRMSLIRMTRYALQGDVRGHVARVFRQCGQKWLVKSAAI